MRFFDVLHNLFSALGDFIKRLLPNPKDTVESRNFKTTVFFIIGCVVFMFVVSLIAFVAFIQPVDETVIPAMVGTDFRQAIGILQNKKLQPLINFEFTSVPQDKDRITKQDPAPREKVRIGSRVTLWVSQGVMYDRVGDYVNMTLDQVENLFKTSFNRDREIIGVKQPVNSISNKAPAGTILAQYPTPGTPIGDRTLLMEFTVSKGIVQTEMIIGDYQGRNFQAVVSELQAHNIPFVFNVETAGANQDPGSVISQNLAAGTKTDTGALLVLEMCRPENVPDTKVFGVFRTALPDFGAPVLIKIEAERQGKRTLLLSQERPGGPVTLPYVLEKDSELILTVAGDEKQPVKVQAY